MTVSRTLNIDVVFNCTHDASNNTFGGSATYSQGGSTPDMGNVVDADGTIHLDNAASFDKTQYSANVDIYFTLASQAAVSPDGGTTPVEWATVNGPGMHITVPLGGSANEFVVQPVPGQPNKILVKDNDDDSNTYNYKPAVELTAHGRYYISLDPRIVNRPA
jgi:hypothetical protein